MRVREGQRALESIPFADLSSTLAARREALEHDRTRRRSPSVRPASEAQARFLVDQLPLMLFKLDRQGTVLSANEHGSQELGYAGGELVGRPVFEVIHPEDRLALERQLDLALDNLGAVLRWELRKLRKDGSEMWVRETVRAVHDPRGAPEILVVCEDVSERRRAVARLAEYRDQLRDLNANLSHAEEREGRRIARVLHDEVGQNLAAVRMAICELRDSEPSSGARSQRLDGLRQMIDTSIEVTRTLTFQLSPPILYELGLAAALQALGERMGQDHDVVFRYEVSEGWSPPPDSVGVVLYRVVRELLHNVVKHARATRMRLDLGGTRDGIRLVVEDDGEGFDVEAPVPAGHLGLFHVRERLERLGGGFVLDAAPGRGTRMELTVPVTWQTPGRGSWS